MRKLLLVGGLLALFSLHAPVVFAVEGLSANVSVTNNYIWRGISQTKDQTAVSGGVDFAHGSGVYVGAWLSNVDFGDSTNSEVDLYTGYSFKVDQFTIDFGYLYYGYPSGDELDFSEIYASVNWAFLTVGYNVLVDSDAGGDFGDADYVFVDLAFEVAKDLELAFYYGRSGFYAGGDYSDYGISLSKGAFSVSLTDVDDNAVESGYLVAVSYSIDFDL